jgi:hypothetical protein
MACDISLGRLEGCKDAVGGLKAVYFINYAGVLETTQADDLITVIGDGVTPPSAYKYDLRGNSTFEQSLTSSRENGTTFAEQTLTVSLKRQDASTHKEIKLLAYGRPHIVIEDNNGDFWVMGEEYGAELSATASTGASMGDKTGYELTFSAMEKTFAKKYESTAGIEADLSIVVGV